MAAGSGEQVDADFAEFVNRTDTDRLIAIRSQGISDQRVAFINETIRRRQLQQPAIDPREQGALSSFEEPRTVRGVRTEKFGLKPIKDVAGRDFTSPIGSPEQRTQQQEAIGIASKQRQNNEIKQEGNFIVKRFTGRDGSGTPQRTAFVFNERGEQLRIASQQEIETLPEGKSVLQARTKEDVQGEKRSFRRGLLGFAVNPRSPTSKGSRDLIDSSLVGVGRFADSYSQQVVDGVVYGQKQGAVQFGLGATTSVLGTIDFGQELATSPVQTINEIPSNIVSSFQRVQSGELARRIKQNPSFALGFVATEALTLKGFSKLPTSRLKLIGTNKPIPQRIVQNTRQLKTPSFIEVQSPINFFGKKFTLSQIKITTEVRPPKLILNSKGKGGFLGTSDKFFIQPSRSILTETTFPTLNKGTSLFETKRGKGFRLQTASSFSQEVKTPDFLSFNKKQKFLFSRLGEEVTGIPQPLKLKRNLFNENSKLFLSESEIITPSLKKGKRFSLFSGATKITPLKIKGGFDIFSSTSVFKDVSKPFSRATGRTFSLKGTIFRKKETLVIGGPDLSSNIITSSLKGKKTKLSQTFQTPILTTKPITKTPKRVNLVPKSIGVSMQGLTIKTPPPISITRQRGKTIQRTNQVQNLGLTTKTLQNLQPKLTTKTLQSQRPSFKVKPLQNLQPKLTTKTLQSQKIKQTSKQIFKQPLGIIPKPFLARQPKIKPPPAKDPKIIKFKPFKPKSFGQKAPKFNVFVRRFGKFNLVGKGLSLPQALNLGKGTVGGTLGATFKLKSLRPTKNIPLKLPGFRTKQTKTGLEFIEKRRFRLSTGTELREIQGFKRKKKKKKKR